MADSAILPQVRAALVAPDGTTTREFYRFFSALAPNAALPARVDDLTVRVVKLEGESGGSSGTIKSLIGIGAVSVVGPLADGQVTLDLKDLADTGTGALLAISRDGKGRVSGTRAALLADVSDVNITGTPTDGYVLTYDSAASKWIPKVPSGGGGGGGVSRPPGNSYTVAASDDGYTIVSGDATSFALTLPLNATVTIPIGAKVAYTQGAAGAITVTGSTGVTVRAPNGNTTGALFDGGVAEKIGTDEWQLWNGPALSALATSTDAPSDGTPYSRQSGGWVAAGSIAGRTMNEQTGTTYTPVIGDINKDFRCTNAAAVSFILPLNSSVALPLCTPYYVFQGGAGSVTISGVTGVTIEAAFGAATTAVKDFRAIYQRATNIWVIG